MAVVRPRAAEVRAVSDLMHCASGMAVVRSHPTLNQQIAPRTGRARGRQTTGIKDAALHLSGLYSLYTRRLESEIRNGGMPNHVALILDGNRRWASRNLGLARAGHWRGADAVENLLDWCEEFDIKRFCLKSVI